MTDNRIALIITSKDAMEASDVVKGYGWGDNGTELWVAGEIGNIRIEKNGVSQIGIRIMEDGELIITDYGSLCYQQQVPQNLKLTPHRGWRER